MNEDFLCTRTSIQGESGLVQLYSSTLRQKSGWMMPKKRNISGLGNDLRTDVERVSFFC